MWDNRWFGGTAAVGGGGETRTMDRSRLEYHLLQRQQNARVVRLVTPVLCAALPVFGGLDVLVHASASPDKAVVPYLATHGLTWLFALGLLALSRLAPRVLRQRATMLMAVLGPVLLACQVGGIYLSGRTNLHLVLVTMLAASFMFQARPTVGLVHLLVCALLPLPLLFTNAISPYTALPEILAVLTGGVILVYIRDGFARQTLDLREKTRSLRREIPTRRQAERQLKRSEDRLAEAQRVAHVGSWEWDFRTHEIYCSDELYRILKLDLAPDHVNTLFGALFERVHPDDQKVVKERIARAFEQQEPYRVEHRIILPDKTVRHLMGQGLILWDEENKPARLIGTVFDITARKQAEEEIKRLAFHDSLTGLANRVLLKERLELELAHARREGTTLAVLFLDLDRFKLVNDSLGHSVGDWLIQQVADRLRSCLRDSDTVARQGGDEFIIVLPNIKNQGNVKMVAEKVLRALQEVYVYEEHELFVSCSIGVALFPVNGDNAADLLKNADAAMYFVKNKGKGAYQFYMDNLNEDVRSRFELEGHLRRGIEKDQFQLYYQPRVSPDSGEIAGLEALIRWFREDGTMVSPADFIPVAEETGLIIPIGDWVTRTACEQHLQFVRRLKGDQPPPMIAVNVSPRQFQLPDLHERVQVILEETELSAGLLEIEITEGTVMQDPERAQATLRKLRNLGVHISIDDFGTGYSSLGYLKRFPIDTLKIDRTFIMGLPGDSEDAAIVESILALARSLKMTTIAEGVETVEQVEFLQERACDELQGFHYCRPLPAEEMIEFLGRWPLLHERRTLNPDDF